MPATPTNPFKPITYGKDNNFYKEVSVSSSIFGGDTAPDGYSAIDGYNCNALITFSTQGVIFLNHGLTSTQVIEVSFNGNTVHDVLDPSQPSKGVTYDNRVISKIWFRVKSGSTGPIIVSIRAWALR